MLWKLRTALLLCSTSWCSWQAGGIGEWVWVALVGWGCDWAPPTERVFNLSGWVSLQVEEKGKL
jgi:hypothetical protein